MPTSYCFNCGGPKVPPFTTRYCNSCEQAVIEARLNTSSTGLTPSEAARRALDQRSFNPKGTRPNPRVPYTKNDLTRDYLDAWNPPPPPAGER